MIPRTVVSMTPPGTGAFRTIRSPIFHPCCFTRIGPMTQPVGSAFHAATSSGGIFASL